MLEKAGDQPRDRVALAGLAQCGEEAARLARHAAHLGAQAVVDAVELAATARAAARERTLVI